MKNRYINSSVFSNISIQILNYVVPMFTYPYLGRILGAGDFGILSFWIAIAGFLSILTEYGYRYSAARLVADDNNFKDVNTIYWGVQYSRYFIFIIIFFSGLFYLIFSGRLDLLPYYLISSTLLLGSTIFPVWYFVGRSYFKEMAVILALPRFFSLICIVFFISNRDQALLAMFFQCMPLLISGLLAQGYLVRSKGLIFKRIIILDVFIYLKNGWNEFVSVLAMSSYQTFPLIILGFTSNSTQVANYAISEKIVQAVKSLTTALGQTIFAKNSSSIKSIDSKLFIKDNFIFVSINIIMIIFVNIFGYYSDLFLGNSYGDFKEIIIVMSFIPLMAGFANVAGIQTLLPLGMTKIFMLSAIGVGSFATFFGIIFSDRYFGLGMAYVVLASEFLLAVIFMMISIRFFMKKKEI